MEKFNYSDLEKKILEKKKDLQLKKEKGFFSFFNDFGRVLLDSIYELKDVIAGNNSKDELAGILETITLIKDAFQDKKLLSEDFMLEMSKEAEKNNFIENKKFFFLLDKVASSIENKELRVEFDGVIAKLDELKKRIPGEQIDYKPFFSKLFDVISKLDFQIDLRGIEGLLKKIEEKEYPKVKEFKLPEKVSVDTGLGTRFEKIEKILGKLIENDRLKVAVDRTGGGGGGGGGISFITSEGKLRMAAVDDDGHLQVDILSGGGSTDVSALATSAKQLADNHQVSVSNFPSSQVVRGTVAISNPTTSPETGLAKEDTLMLLRDIRKLLKASAYKDVGDRQIVKIGALGNMSGGVELTTTLPVSGTVSSTVANLPAVGGLDARF